MIRKIALFFSYLLHPGLMPSLGIIALFQAETFLKYSVDANTKNALYTIVYVNTYLFPALILLLMRYLKAVKSIQLKKRKERPFPFLLGLLFYIFSFYLMSNLDLPSVIFDLFFGIILSLFFVLIITLKYKISVHLTGISGVIGTFLGVHVFYGIQLSVWIVGLIFLWGIIGTSRLQLKAHTNGQIILGSFIGFVTVLSSIFYGWGSSILFWCTIK